MESDYVKLSELKEWLDEAKNTDDILAVIEEYKGKDIFMAGWNFAVSLLSYKSDTDSLEIILEAYCPQHPDVKYTREIFVRNGETLYKCFLDLINPFRKIHPRHD